MIDTVRRWLWIDDERWARIGPHSLAPASAIVVVASGLLAFVRFGGLTVQSPRAFARLTLTGIWGWMLLTALLVIVAVATRLVRVEPGDGAAQLRLALAIVGRSHLPVLVLVGATMVAGFFLQLHGPGLAVAVFVVGLWFPAALVSGVRGAARVSTAAAVGIVAGPYLVWCWLIARPLFDQVGHLL